MATIKKAQNGYKSNPYATADKAKKPVVSVKKKTTVKVTPKKKTDNDVQMYKGPKGEVLSGEGFDARNQNYNMLKKNGGMMKKAKNGKSFPDLNKDGKITKADILKGRGVIAKKGATVKKAFLGSLLGGGAGKSMLGGMGKQMLGGLAGKALGGMMKKGGSIKKDESSAKMKSGGSMKKCKYGCK